MKWLWDSLYVAVGACFGANSRYWLSTWIQFHNETAFPWGTFVVNVSGCLVIGVVNGLILGLQLPAVWRPLVVVGFLGGYTTFSSFSAETYGLLQRGNYFLVGCNICASVFVGLLGTWLGDVLSNVLTGAGR